MKKLVLCLAAAVALNLAAPLVVADPAEAAGNKAALKVCTIKSGKKKMTWSCEPGQACCVTAEGKGVCGMTGIGCL